MFKTAFSVFTASVLVSFAAAAQVSTPSETPPAPHETQAEHPAPAEGAITQKPLDKKTKANLKRERIKKKHGKALQKIQDMDQQTPAEHDVK